MPVTSRPQSEHGLPIATTELVSGSLPASSWVRTNRVITLNQSLVVKTIGRTSERVVVDATERLFAYIGRG
jgi:mRNA interferase MazF